MCSGIDHVTLIIRRSRLWGVNFTKIPAPPSPHTAVSHIQRNPLAGKNVRGERYVFTSNRFGPWDEKRAVNLENARPGSFLVARPFVATLKTTKPKSSVSILFLLGGPFLETRHTHVLLEHKF